MDKNTLDRLRQLAGTAPKTQYAADQSRMNMYQIRDTLTESSAVDRARYDADSKSDKTKVTLKKAPWEKEKESVKESEDDDDEVTADDEEYERGVAKARRRNPDFANESKTEADLMREWANSIYQQYDDAGTVQEQPEGETVDLSLRRYLNATPQKVTAIAEDIQPEDLLREYKDFIKAKPKSASKKLAAEKKSK